MEYKGKLEGFPTEVIEKMLEKQVEQGNVRDVKVFEVSYIVCATDGGFDWDKTDEGRGFWSRVIGNWDFDLFFKKYPKPKTRKQFLKADLKTGMLVQNDEGAVYLLINNTFVGVCVWDDLCNYDSVLKNSVASSLDIVKVSNILKDRFLKPNNWTEETLNKNLLWEKSKKTIGNKRQNLS